MWLFRFTVEAEIDFARLDKGIQARVAERLRWFVRNFEHVIPLPLGGQWSGFFKIRVGDWRVIYETKSDSKTIVVHLIDHRGRIYKRKPTL